MCWRQGLKSGLAAVVMAGTMHAALPQTLVTTRGKVYHDVRVVKVESDGLTFRHERGVAKVPLRELPAETLAQWQGQIQAAQREAQAVQARRAAAQRQRAAQPVDPARVERVQAAARQLAARRPEWALSGTPVPAATPQVRGIGWRAITNGSRGRRWRGGHVEDWYRPYRVLYVPSFYDFRAPSYPVCPPVVPQPGFQLRR